MDSRNAPRSKMQDVSDKGPKGEERSKSIKQEVKSMFKYGKNTMTWDDMSNLKKKYGDAKIIEEIYKEFTKEYNRIVDQAEKFADSIIERYGTAKYPMHKVIEKALKYKEKLNLSDSAFEEFKRLYEQRLAGVNLEQYTYRTVIAKALGDTPIKAVEGLMISDAEHAQLQEILRLYKESEIMYHQVMLQALSYKDCAQIAFNGKFDITKHNPANHVHPVLAALFLPKVQVIEEHILYANIGYIVKCKYEKKVIDTKPNYELYWDIIRDPNDVVCSVDSPMADLLNRFKLQIKIWESVMALRIGQYYRESFPGFLQTIDNCRTNIYDMPELMYVKDEGAILRRLLAAFSLRPTVVTTTPLYGMISANPYDRVKLMPVLKQVPMITIRFPPTVLNSDSPINLQDALQQGHWYIENGNLVPKAQSILYSRDVLFFYVNRRFQNIDPVRYGRPYTFTMLPLTTSGYEQLNERSLDFELTLQIRNDSYDLRSVVCVESVKIKDDPACANVNLNIITGCSALIVVSRHVADVANDAYMLYNPSAPSSMYRAGQSQYEQRPPMSEMYIESFNREQPSIFDKAGTTGTIFMYVKRPPQTLCSDLL
jgi:hypothetical protein